MKNMKKIVALLVAVMMIVASMSVAFADTNNVTLDTAVTVSNLDENDSVKFVKFIEWIDGSGWAYTTAFKTAAQAANVTLPELTTITGYKPENADFVPGKISAPDGATIAKVAATMTATETIDAGDDGTVTYDAPKAGDTITEAEKLAFSGLYCALVTPATADWLYNPIFVAADFSQASTSPNSQAATVERSYSPAALAKKEQVTLSKEITGTANGSDAGIDAAGNTKYDVDVGDVIDFEIASKVPAFSAAYQNPTYEIHDTWEEGLDTPADLVVTIDNVTMAKDTDYTYTVDATNRTFTIALTSSRLATITNAGLAQDIKVTYKSKITSLESANVTEKYNDAEVKFSNNPGDSSSYSLIEDKTRNYTFSIDASLLGKTGESYWTDELIKTGLDEKGNLLTTRYEYHSGTTTTELSPLQGAEFALFKSEPVAADYASHDAAVASKKLYTNTVFTTGFVTSDPYGRLNIQGLDCGTYYLKEISAPAGFIKDNRLFTITIAAKYTTIPATSYEKNVGTAENPKNITVNVNSYEVLDEYSVTVVDNEGHTNVSTYNILNDGPVNDKKVTAAKWEELGGKELAGDKVTPINNTKGTELPSTGGMGTTILYIGGSILVILAAVLLITKRRMNAED